VLCALKIHNKRGGGFVKITTVLPRFVEELKQHICDFRTGLDYGTVSVFNGPAPEVVEPRWH